MKLSTIDVFSGTGGISLALKDFADTMLYCEWHPYCQAVLAQRMKEGLLDKAPIHSDITTLHVAPCTKPDMLIGGFPCTDISSIGLQQGINQDTRSGLFLEMMRIVDECPSIKVVFLENVTNILRCGLKEVIAELTARGFSFRWTCRSASMFGAPHVRSRWFCLAVRGDITEYCEALREASLLEGVVENKWQSFEGIAPAVFKPAVKDDANYDEHWSVRCQCLGNAVVPSVVKYAFVELLKSYDKWASIADCLVDASKDALSQSYPFLESGLVVDGKLYDVPKAHMDTVKHSIPIKVCVSEDKTVELQHFPTPRRGITHASTLTDRSMKDLPTVVLNSTITKDYLASIEEAVAQPLHQSLYVNVNFVEWLMGYEKDWTKCTGYSSIKSNASKAASKIVSASAHIDDEGDDGDDNSEGNEDSEASANADNASSSSHQRTKARKTTNVATMKPKSSINGMHIFMRDNPNKPLTVISQMWKGLAADVKAEYGAKAKNERMLKNNE